MITKYISVKEIINKVYRDSGIQSDLNWQDMIEWTAEALNLIGNPKQYIRKVTGYIDTPNLDITNYRAKLPCDFHKLEQIAVNGRPARYASNTFHHLLSGRCCGFNNTTEEDTDIFTDNFGNSFSPQSSLVPNYTSIDDVTFDINNDYITLSVETGKVCIAYLAIPTDSEGFPLVPDVQSYREAIKWFIIKNLSYIDWMTDKITKDKFQHAEMEWEWYVAQAANKAKDLSYDQMEALKVQMIRLVPKNDNWLRFHSGEGHEQIRIQ